MLTFFKRWSWQKTLSAALIALMALCVFFLLWSYSQGKFDSVESMQAYVSSFGAFAPVVLTVVQAGQVVVPIRISGIVLLACAGAAFLIPFRLKKPYRIGKVIMIVVGALEFCVLALGAS